MNSKKKLIVALSSLCFVLVAAVVTVVAVLAAAQQTITSNINVTYTASQIAGSVTATSKYEDGTKWDAIGSDNVVSFNGGDANVDAEVDGNYELKITEGEGAVTRRYVAFKYDFTNIGSKAYTATVTYTDADPADVNVKCVFSTTEIVATGEGETAKTAYENVLANTNLVPATGATASVSVPALTGTATMYIYVVIENVALDASFSGSFNWTLA